MASMASGPAAARLSNVGYFANSSFSDDVHPGIRALSGQADADQQLPGILIRQRTFADRILLFQTLHDLTGYQPLCAWGFPFR